MCTATPDCADVIQRVADAYWKRFSDRIMAAYVTGSHAGGYAVPGSDIDLVFVLAGAVTEQDRSASAALTKELHGTTRLGLDLDLVGSNDAVRPALKLDSVLVRGSDVRDRLSVMPLTDWIAERRYAACWLMSHLFGRPGIAQIPLAFPDEAGEFFGYNTDRGGVSDGPEGSTKDLVRSTSWAATALVATESECFLTSKAHLLDIIGDYLPEEWARHTRNLLDFCRCQTNYEIPTSTSQRARLRELCIRTREFEDYYLSRHLKFLLAELSSSPDRARIARAKIAENRLPRLAARLILGSGSRNTTYANQKAGRHDSIHQRRPHPIDCRQ